MFNFKPELREGETVIGEYGAFVYRSDGHVSSIGDPIRLWLTNQRLILKKSQLGPQRTLPLYLITNIREQEVTRVTIVRVEFANGHVEWFSTIQNQSQFVDAVRTAQAQAPQVPDTASYPPISPRVPAMVMVFIIFMITVSACGLLGTCFVVAVTMLAGSAQ